MTEADRPILRPTWVDVDLDAIRSNVRALHEAAHPAALMTVVKADGYGHGAVPVARAALDAGATWLGVALVEEGVALRAAGIGARVMVLSEAPSPDAAAVAVAHDLTPVAYSAPGIDALAKAVADAGRDAPAAVHLKVDTGMHRVGCAPDDLLDRVAAIQARDELWLEGVCTHLAVSDEPENPYTAEQLERFDALVADLEARGLRPPLVHAANSGGLLAFPERAKYDLVRAGIATYGQPPSPVLSDRARLRPALTFRSHVTYVKTLPAGSRLSYGLRYSMPRTGRVATVPVGYADGVPRGLAAAGGEVLMRGRRRPLAGTVTMDQLMVDVGDGDVKVGDEVILIGRQGDEEVTAAEWGARMGTIAYEIVCRISARVPRRYV